MEKAAHSLWYAVSIGLLGLAIGYTLVIVQNHSIVFASAPYCPARAHTECTGEDCMQGTSCASGQCDHTCPGCNKQPTI